MHQAFGVRDADMKKTLSLPGGASTTVNSVALDLRKSPNGHFLAGCELEIEAPAVTTTMVPDDKTMSYRIIHGNAIGQDGKISDASVLLNDVIVQTGAGGAGANGSTFRARLPQNVKRYVALRIVSGSGTTDSSAKEATLSLLF